MATPGGGVGLQWRRQAKSARRYARSGTRGLGWRESVGQPLGCPVGEFGADGAVRREGEWLAAVPGRD